MRAGRSLARNTRLRAPWARALTQVWSGYDLLQAILDYGETGSINVRNAHGIRLRTANANAAAILNRRKFTTTTVAPWRLLRSAEELVQPAARFPSGVRLAALLVRGGVGACASAEQRVQIGFGMRLPCVPTGTKAVGGRPKEVAEIRALLVNRRLGAVVRAGVGSAVGKVLAHATAMQILKARWAVHMPGDGAREIVKRFPAIPTFKRDRRHGVPRGECRAIQSGEHSRPRRSMPA